MRRATIVGTGLIGGSVGLALRSRGWRVSGTDVTPGLVRRAVELGACDAEGVDPDSELVVVATPVGNVVPEVQAALAACPSALVTDVGGVKADIVARIDDPRFVGGHPMAGSEQLGLEGAHAELFEGAVWVLCPGTDTADATYTAVRETVADFGAQVLTMSGADHDRLVAVVSHVPHLTAAALVHVAGDHANDHAALLRLAAGGFRDMTRVAAGSPGIWPGVCEQNREAILATLDQLRDELGAIRATVADGDSTELLRVLGEAQQVRRNLPSRPSDAGPYSEIRVLIEDQPGAVQAVATLATDLDVNLAGFNTFDFEGSAKGMAVLRVVSADAERLCRALLDAGFRAFVQHEEES